MFGILQTSACHLSPTERQDWVAQVCGLCLTLRNDHGQLSRLTTNYDAALLSVLVEAQSAETLPRTSNVCPLRRLRRAEVAENQPGARFAAAICVLMAATKISDHVADGESWLRFLPTASNGLAADWANRARRSASTLGFDTDAIEAQTHRQIGVEQRDSRDFYIFSQPTEIAVAAAFSHTAVLASRPSNVASLDQIGRMYGRIMYLLDSYRDYSTDRAHKQFNALARCFAQHDVQRQARQLFAEAHAAIERYVDQLTLSKPSLVRKLLLGQLKQIGTRTIDLPPTPEAAGVEGHARAAAPERKRQDGSCWGRLDCNPCECCDCGECCNCCDGCDGCDACNCCDCS